MSNDNSEDSSNNIVQTDKPYVGAVRIEDVLIDIQALVEKYMSLPKGSSVTMALWIAGTYVYDDFLIFPKLSIISPEKRCGKTTLLEIIDALACKSLLASNITPAAIFRVIDIYSPTLIIDEADTFISGRNDEMIGIINSGHRRASARVIRATGDSHMPKSFSTWSPMALAAIKRLPSTVEDRSIVIQLERKTVADRVHRMPIDLKDRCKHVREKLVAWANEFEVKQVSPPTISNDRAMDNWSPLFSIAHSAGWIDKVKTSFMLLNKETDEQTPSIMLLSDIRDIFEKESWLKISSAELTDKLVVLEERPWCEWKRGQPMTQNSLSKMLGAFNIKSKQIRSTHDNSKVVRGFDVEQFADGFNRYLPEKLLQSATTLQTR
ncbi:MAG: DUF3631 domain-containing protein [Candidatus Thioglobus sp.]|jgi:hypothetical protein